jgi:hypothetical protein
MAWRERLARRQAQEPAPASPQQPAASRVTYRAVMSVAGRGTSVLGSGITDQRFARLLCEGTQQAKALGKPLQWTERKPGVWVAGNTAIAWAIAAEGTARATA